MRLEHTSRTFERSRECQGISAIVTLQQDWLLGIARDYAELNKRFGEVLHEMTEHGANGVSEAIAEAAGTKKTPKPERPGERAAAA
jgi:hypothetical protein